MSQIKQYGARGPLSDPPILGEYIMVTYADHLDALRACEERVEESIDRAWEQAAQLAVAHARTATLDAAREAVAALDAYYAIEECEGNPLEKGDPEDPDPWHQGHLIERDDALAAIDALKEKP